jgi:hypothetical protein
VLEVRPDRARHRHRRRHGGRAGRHRRTCGARPSRRTGCSLRSCGTWRREGDGRGTYVRGSRAVLTKASAARKGNSSHGCHRIRKSRTVTRSTTATRPKCWRACRTSPSTCRSTPRPSRSRAAGVSTTTRLPTVTCPTPELRGVLRALRLHRRADRPADPARPDLGRPLHGRAAGRGERLRLHRLPGRHHPPARKARIRVPAAHLHLEGTAGGPQPHHEQVPRPPPDRGGLDENERGLCRLPDPLPQAGGRTRSPLPTRSACSNTRVRGDARGTAASTGGTTGTRRRTSTRTGSGVTTRRASGTTSGSAACCPTRRPATPKTSVTCTPCNWT